MPEPSTGMERLAVAVDGARWVRYDVPSRRVFVWKAGSWIDVLRVDTGEVLGNYVCDGTLESVESVVQERLSAGY